MEIRCDDLSNGMEFVKVAVLNQYNYQPLPAFKYIKELESSEELKFYPSKDCTCVSTCRHINCCDGISNFCNVSCFKLLQNRYQVFYVNEQKGWGLRTMQDIKENSILFEYTGLLSYDHEKMDNDDYIFIFEFQQKIYMIDAHAKGNLARFVNHSCSPNCFTQLSITQADGLPHLLIITNRKITAGEELTLDYGDDWWEIKMAKGKTCICGIMCRYSKNETSNKYIENEATTSVNSASGVNLPRKMQTATKSCNNVRDPNFKRESSCQNAKEERRKNNKENENNID